MYCTALCLKLCKWPDTCLPWNTLLKKMVPLHYSKVKTCINALEAVCPRHLEEHRSNVRPMIFVCLPRFSFSTSASAYARPNKVWMMEEGADANSVRCAALLFCSVIFLSYRCIDCLSICNNPSTHRVSIRPLAQLSSLYACVWKKRAACMRLYIPVASLYCLPPASTAGGDIEAAWRPATPQCVRSCICVTLPPPQQPSPPGLIACWWLITTPPPLHLLSLSHHILLMYCFSVSPLPSFFSSPFSLILLYASLYTLPLCLF